MKGKQAVVETSLGTIVIQLLPDAAPNHVGHFIKIAGEGGSHARRHDLVQNYACPWSVAS